MESLQVNYLGRFLKILFLEVERQDHCWKQIFNQDFSLYLLYLVYQA